MMRVAVLTSSRADYGIYRPLLVMMQNDPDIDLRIIAFGTHLSESYGMTINEILADGFNVDIKVETVPSGDSRQSISDAMGRTTSLFSDVWDDIGDDIDLVFCLGDRYEMFSAVSASVPFNIRLAHIHGGETTLGAIDNIFRHCITLMADYHFTTTKQYADRVIQLTSDANHVYNVGSLSLDNIGLVPLLSKTEFRDKFDIDLNKSSILFTYHPETAGAERNGKNIRNIIDALKLLSDYQIIITMPNADTSNIEIRDQLNEYIHKNKDHVFGIEHFGTQAYFTCLENCSFVMGNSSSGIIEAASFGRYVINIGDRQKGRASGNNVIHVSADKTGILEAVEMVEKAPVLDRENIYWNGGAAKKIMEVVKEISSLEGGLRRV